MKIQVENSGGTGEDQAISDQARVPEAGEVVGEMSKVKRVVF